MTRRLAPLLALLVASLLAAVARADGKMFRPVVVQEPPETPSQRALLAFDEVRGVETLVVETTIDTGRGAGADAAAEYAWVLPLPARPAIEASTTGFFPSLEAFCAPEVRVRPDPGWMFLLGTGLGLAGTVRWWGRGLAPLNALGLTPAAYFVSMLLACAMFPLTCAGSLGASAAPTGAQVLARKPVGVFDTTTLTATDAPALRRWLTENGFDAPESIDPVVTDLLREGWVFVASKVRPGAAAGPVRLHPLAFTFPSRQAVYPMRLTGVGATAPLELELFVCGARRAEAVGLQVLDCARRDERWKFHDEFALRSGGAPVLTKLAGRLEPAAMSRDVVLAWTDFVPAKTVWFDEWAAQHEAALPATIAGALLLLVWAIASRRVAACERPFTWHDAKAFAAAAIVAGLTWGIAYLRVPRVPDGATLVIPRDAPLADALLGSTGPPGTDAAALRAWAASQTAETLNSYTGERIREEDSPGNWWISERGGRSTLWTWERVEWLPQSVDRSPR